VLIGREVVMTDDGGLEKAPTDVAQATASYARATFPAQHEELSPTPVLRRPDAQPTSLPLSNSPTHASGTMPVDWGSVSTGTQDPNQSARQVEPPYPRFKRRHLWSRSTAWQEEAWIRLETLQRQADDPGCDRLPGRERR
jgi:hypothetical protein